MPESAAPKALTFKRAKGMAQGTAIIESISEDRVTLRHGPKPEKNSKEPVAYPDTSHVYLPKGMIQGLRVGQRVRIKLEVL